MLQIKFDARNQGHWIVMFAVLILGVSISSYLYSTDRYSLVYFGDSASHLLGARKIVDWMDPGLQQVGTVWLPLPHFLLLPFALIDPMFTSGLAGTAVSLPSLAITVAILYRMVKTHLGEAAGYISFVAAMLYATNPNILYLGVTAMTEAPFMLFFVASAYYFQKWSADHLRAKNLVLCSIFVILATLCRYEGWILAAFLVPFVIFTSFKGNLDSKSKKVERILLSAISLLGIAAWIGYNAYQYGDPLEFANAQYYSASSQALDRSIRETLFLQPINVISIYGTTAFMIFGPVLLVAALTGYICHRRMQGSNSRRILYVYLALPPLFSIITILVGIGEMTYWFNSRFLILLSPLIILLTAVYLHN
ncbi:MAG: glycosyltransferase family 39 protein, partial [Nitrososphaera sp.]